MKVLLIGKTEVDLFPFQGDSRHHMPGKAEGSEFQRRVAADSLSRSPHSGEQSGQELIEFAGRLCYESFDLPGEKTKTNSAYVQNIVELGHESVLEHVSVTFYVEGVSRNLTHELIRHRHLSFSELSQRFVNMQDANYIIPPLFRENFGADKIKLSEVDDGNMVAKYNHNVSTARGELDATRKQAREASRYVIPSAVETKLVVSGNLRAWRDVLKKRLSVHADAEMQLFARTVWGILSAEYPDVFADIQFQEK